MRSKIFSKILIFFMVLSPIDIFANDITQYNIFLIPDQSTKTYINSFNHLANENGLYKKYAITPFSSNHPVHLSLYLTSFKKDYLENIFEQINSIANTTKPFYITTNKITVGKSGFVMLNVNNTQVLQNLSNRVITHLNKYRNRDYPIPNWVKYYPDKQKSFEKYGSPNAFKQFNPHFSILAKNLESNKIKQNFVNEFNKVIKSFNPQPKKFKIIGIGFGKVDNNGQLTKTLHIYKLNS